GVRPWCRGTLMNTRGLMELIVLNIGLDLKVISPTVFTMMVLMALATTMATTPILHALAPVGMLSRRRTTYGESLRNGHHADQRPANEPGTDWRPVPERPLRKARRT